MGSQERGRASGDGAIVLSVDGKRGALTPERKRARTVCWESTLTDVASNKPIGKADVDVRRLDGAPYCNAVSDANGTAWIHLAPGAYEIYDAMCEGYTYEGSRQAVVVEQGATRTVMLSLTPDVHGVVRDLTGAPVAGRLGQGRRRRPRRGHLGRAREVRHRLVSALSASCGAGVLPGGPARAAQFGGPHRDWQRNEHAGRAAPARPDADRPDRGPQRQRHRRRLGLRHVAGSQLGPDAFGR